MAEHFGVPNRLASKILSTLSESGLLHEVEGGDTAFVPAQPLSQISVQHVLRALRASQGHELATPDDLMRPVVRAEFDAVRAAEESRATAVSLDEIVMRSLGNKPS